MLRLLAVVVAVAVTGCVKPEQQAFVAACPGAFRELPASLEGTVVSCTCPLGVGSGPVWGSSPYTEDSMVCRAAVHAGAIDPAKGGVVKVTGARGCSRYTGSTRAEVQTSKWGAFPKSFVFPGHGEQSCLAPVVDQCPATYAELGEPGDVFRCTCTDDDVLEGGSVWGNGIYTRDSSLCRAAVHAGAIPVAGGKVVVRPAPGCPKYVGSTKNGISTSRWGAYAGSFYFEDRGHGECAVVPADACPDTFLAIPSSESVTKLSCTCAGDEGGAVWGSGTYTRDSSICAAALHAGAISTAGGKVTVHAAVACDAYEGSVKNGVTTGSWGPCRPGSFVFDGAREPCAR
ncbi:MAG: hypothetical protein JNK82_43140 [Myxococcaceae bacterium]|nr:hypothetical protein [Myxococcaceae bacterium]